MKRASWKEFSSSSELRTVTLDPQAIAAAIARVERELPRLDAGNGVEKRIADMKRLAAVDAVIATDLVWVLGIVRVLDRTLTRNLHTPVYVATVQALFARTGGGNWRRPDEPLHSRFVAFQKQATDEPRILWEREKIGPLRRLLDYLRRLAHELQDRFLRRFADDLGTLVDIAVELGVPS